MDKSIKRAREILEKHIKNVTILDNEILSIILVGSLSNNSYTGKAGSDIDLIHILRDHSDKNTRDTVLDLIELTQNQTNNDIPISKCIYNYSDLFYPYRTDFQLSIYNKDYIELPIELLRVKDSGVIIYGKDILNEINSPRREDIIQFEYLSKKWNSELEKMHPEHKQRRDVLLKNPPIRIIAQSVLTGAMLDYYFVTNKSCSSKLDILRRMEQEVPQYLFLKLLKLSSKWRYEENNFTETDEAEMIELFRDWKDKKKNIEIGFVHLKDSKKF